MKYEKFNKYLKERKYHGYLPENNSELKELEPEFEKTFNYIGVFLNQIIMIEIHLDEILELHLAKNRNGFNGAAFKSLLLNGRFFNIFEKQKMFGDLTKTTFLLFKLLKEEESKIIRKLLSEVINHRNIIAHNRFGISIERKNPIFKYYEAGQIKDLELSESDMIENLEKGNSIIQYLKDFKVILKRHEDE